MATLVQNFWGMVTCQELDPLPSGFTIAKRHPTIQVHVPIYRICQNTLINHQNAL